MIQYKKVLSELRQQKKILQIKDRLEKQDKQNYSTLPRIFLRFFIYQLQKVLSKNRIGTPPRMGRKTLDQKKKARAFALSVCAPHLNRVNFRNIFVSLCCEGLGLCKLSITCYFNVLGLWGGVGALLNFPLDVAFWLSSVKFRKW